MADAGESVEVAERGRFREAAREVGELAAVWVGVWESVLGGLVEESEDLVSGTESFSLITLFGGAGGAGGVGVEDCKRAPTFADVKKARSPTGTDPFEVVLGGTTRRAERVALGGVGVVLEGDTTRVVAVMAFEDLGVALRSWSTDADVTEVKSCEGVGDVCKLSG